MAEFTIHQLAKTTDSDALEQRAGYLRAARLKSLKLDPSAFYTKYENEADKPLSFFIARLSPMWVDHFVVFKDGKEDVCYGFSAVVNITDRALEKGQPLSAADFNSVDHLDDNLVIYNLGAVWIDPAARGLGLGTQLVEASLDFIRQDIKRYQGKRALAYLGAKPDNHGAIRLYERLGFKVFENKSEAAISVASIELARYVE